MRPNDIGNLPLRIFGILWARCTPRLLLNPDPCPRRPTASQTGGLPAGTSAGGTAGRPAAAATLPRALGLALGLLFAFAVGTAHSRGGLTSISLALSTSNALNPAAASGCSNGSSFCANFDRGCYLAKSLYTIRMYPLPSSCTDAVNNW